MSTARNFVFLDKKKKRWRKINRVFLVLILLGDVTIAFAAFAIFSAPVFGPSLLEKFGKTPNEMIDIISIQKSEKIEVTSNGPVVAIKQDDTQLILQRQKNKTEKTVLLTFDDGPDPYFTPKILEILEKEGVPAVFFVVGEQLFRHPSLAEKIVKGGHQIGVHTFSHPSEGIDLYNQQDKLGFELDFSQKIIQAQTGHKTRLFRVPYWGAENTISLNSLVFLTMALDRGYTIIPPTIDSLDWYENKTEKVIANAVNTNGIQAVLLHDGGGDRTVTISALSGIIKNYKGAGYQFKTADVLFEGEKLMVPATFFESVTSKFAYAIFWLKTYFFILFNPIFKLGLGLTGAGVLFVLALSIIHSLRNSEDWSDSFFPTVSVLVPAYNEEKTIEKTIKSLLNSDYPDFEIIVINNNSKDNTEEMVRQLTYGNVKLINEKRQGKFAALNRGIESATGEIIVNIDADTQVLPNTISELVRPFENEQVGAVAGNLRIGNIVNPLTAFQAVEYIVSLHLDRRAYDVLGAVPVVPGALGAWRKKAVKTVGSYQEDTLTEDADLTVRIQERGYKAVFVDKAVAYTEAPESLQAFLRQRFRWTLGMLQVLYKHKRIYFSRKHGVLGVVVLPYLALVQLPMMLVLPILDLLALIFFLFFAPLFILRYFLFFLILNFSLTLVAFVLAKEPKIWLMIFLPMHRVLYQGIWYFTLYRSVFAALKGHYIPWTKSVHFGSVTTKETRKPVLPAPKIVIFQSGE